MKIATLGGAVLAMSFFMLRRGHLVPLPQIAIFGVLTLLAVVLMAHFVRSIGSQEGRSRRLDVETGS